MLRLIGILTGSALAIGFLIIAIGVPQLSPPEDEAEATAGAIAGDSSMTDAGLVAAEPQANEADVGPEPQPEPERQPVADSAAEAGNAPAPIEEMTADETEALVDSLFAPATVVDAPPPEPEPAIEDHWYAFWSPFRSEIAANGFVSKLQEKTGIDYRVVKVKTGVYEVAFAYADEDDIRDKLARISTATGLDMTGS